MPNNLYINEAKKEIYTLIRKYTNSVQPRGYVIWHCLKIKRVNENFYKILEKDNLKEDYMDKFGKHLPDEIQKDETIEILDMTKDNFHEITNVFLIEIILKSVKEWAAEEETKSRLRNLSYKI